MFEGNGEARAWGSELRVPLSPTDSELFKKLLDHVSDAVYVADRERRIVYCNEAAIRLTGYRAEDVKANPYLDGGPGHEENSLLWESLRDGIAREANILLRHKLGWRIPVAMRVEPIRAADGSVIGAVQIFSDNSPQQKARRKAEAMQHLAFLDFLTEIPNRRFMEMSLETALREFKITASPFGLLMVDIDGFKAINDSCGHVSGDQALKQVAKTLAETLRPTDTVGRWGGDEFLAIVRNMDKENLTVLADRCVSNVAQISYPGADGRPKPISISVGGTLARIGDTADALIKRADRLMYQSKTAHRSRAVIGQVEEPIHLPRRTSRARSRLLPKSSGIESHS
jgi:diguanylate cyclase (GGDEF)-like protein/PAS domain S-box-containing protein